MMYIAQLSKTPWFKTHTNFCLSLFLSLTQHFQSHTNSCLSLPLFLTLTLQLQHTLSHSHKLSLTYILSHLRTLSLTHTHQLKAIYSLPHTNTSTLALTPLFLHESWVIMMADGGQTHEAPRCPATHRAREAACGHYHGTGLTGQC